jgi:hypothetical protein
VLDLAEEGCMVTKCVKYTHQLAYWIDVVDKGDSCVVVSTVHRGYGLRFLSLLLTGGSPRVKICV